MLCYHANRAISTLCLHNQHHSTRSYSAIPTSTNYGSTISQSVHLDPSSTNNSPYTSALYVSAHFRSRILLTSPHIRSTKHITMSITTLSVTQRYPNRVSSSAMLHGREIRRMSSTEHLLQPASRAFKPTWKPQPMTRQIIIATPQPGCCILAQIDFTIPTSQPHYHRACS